ncbi:MAG: hypothetical protein H6700_11205 [Myxococcales bacterium]|nr:hypothetical protein [Myxococcales bacterium]
MTLAPGESLDDVLSSASPGWGSLAGAVVAALDLQRRRRVASVREVPFNDPGDVAPPAASALGRAIALDGVTLTVTDASVTWLRLTDAAGKSGYASAPVLKIAFTATNTGSATTEYVGASSPTAPISLLRADGTAVPRATFPGGITVDGQLATATQIGAGESIQNFFLFERPAADVTQLQLIVPGRRFGRTGLARVTVPYTFADPAAPEELTTPRVIEAPAGQ